MLRVLSILSSDAWDSSVACDALTLPFDQRHRRRIRLTSDGGLDLLLDLPQAVVLHDGDGLALADGRVVRVTAAREPLLRISADRPDALARLAWHLGNRHVPAQIGSAILIRDDPVLAAMLTGLGANVERVDAPFTPESGAYSAAHRHDRPPMTQSKEDSAPMAEQGDHPMGRP